MHIVINSLRIYEVPLLPYMDRPADTLEGCKHRCTNAAMEYFKSEVMEMCHREGLYQIDLLSGSKERITEREYWAAKKGQLALDISLANAKIKKEVKDGGMDNLFVPMKLTVLNVDDDMSEEIGRAHV